MYTVTLKSIGLSCSSLGYFTCVLPVLDFITLDIGHLENVILLNYATLPNVDTGNFITQYKIAYYYTISKKKSHILISPPISFLKKYKYWEAVKLKVVETSFLHIFTWKLEFYHLKWKAHYFLIWKNVKYPSLNYYSLSISSSFK